MLNSNPVDRLAVFLNVIIKGPQETVWSPDTIHLTELN